jgi:TRAP-type uncharacterized transport system fused permease subunit
MFILYIGMLSYITPPIAMAAFPAAVLAKTSPMKVACSAARMGAGKYILPFLFVLDPALLLIGTPTQIVTAVVTTLFGMFIISASLEGYMLGLGVLWPGKGKGSLGGYTHYSYALRTILVAAGFLCALPWMSYKISGFTIIAVILLPTIIIKVSRKNKDPAVVTSG